MAEMIPNLMKTITPQIQEAQQIPSTRNRKKTTQKHILNKVLNNHESLQSSWRNYMF